LIALPLILLGLLAAFSADALPRQILVESAAGIGGAALFAAAVAAARALTGAGGEAR